MACAVDTAAACVVGQARWQRDGDAGVTGDERAPTAVGGKAADMVTDLVVGDVRPDRGHHTREIGTQLRQTPVEAGVLAEGDEDIGEVDAGRGDRDLDLSWPRRNAFERNEFHRLQVTGRADLQAHTVVLRGPRRWFAAPPGAAECGCKRAVYHSSFRQAVSSSSDPSSSCRATCSASVSSSTSIWVARKCGCSVPITRIRPRSPACSRLAQSPATTVWAFLVTRYRRGGSPGISGSSRAMRTR